MSGRAIFTSKIWGAWLILFTPNAHAALVVPIEQIGAQVLSHSKILESLKAETEAARFDAELAGTLPNPYLGTQIGTLQTGGVQGVTVESALSQTIPFPGRLSAQQRVRDLEVGLREMGFEKAALILQHEATLIGFRWAELEEESQHFLERKRRFQLIQDYLKSHPQPSPTQQITRELLQRQIQILEKEFTGLEDQRAVINLELKYLLGADQEVRIQPHWLKASDVPPRSSLQETRNKSPELRMRAFEVEQAQAEVAIARKKTYPDFTLGVGYRLENVQPANHFYYGSLGLAIPIFDRGQSSIPAARAREVAKTAASESFQARLKLEIDQAWSRVEAAGKMVGQMPIATADETEEQFKKVEREFRKGRVSIDLLLQADAQLHASVSAVYEAQVNFARRLSDLYRLHGLAFRWK